MFYSIDKRLGDGSEQFNKIVGTLKKSFDSVKEEFDEHLLAINENTSEQQVQNDHICEMDNRLSKMEERMDEIHNMLTQAISKPDISVQLEREEQKAFLLLYTSDNFITTEKMSMKLGMPIRIVQNAVESLIDKAIPVERELIDGKVYFRMNKEFRLRQAKEEIIPIDVDVKQQYQNTLLKQFFEA